MARDRGEEVCDAVREWARRRRRAKRRDERPEEPGRSETEEPAESRGDRYWRSRAYSREATICSVGFRQPQPQRRVPGKEVGNGREPAAR
jgi:hypothetical protein